MNLAGLIFQVLGGAATGYWTNHFAIKMLFRKYWRLGGVILKTKDEFIKNTSKLVERDIINHHTIEEELETEEFRAVFKEIVAEFLTNSLYKKTQEMKLEDIPCLEQTVDNLLDFYGDNSPTFLPIYLIDLLAVNLTREDIISNSGLEDVVTNLLDKAKMRKKLLRML